MFHDILTYFWPVIEASTQQYSDGQALFLFIATFAAITMISAGPVILGVLFLIFLYYLFIKE